jgi:hypothetical protein
MKIFIDNKPESLRHMLSHSIFGSILRILLNQSKRNFLGIIYSNKVVKD